MYKCELVLVLVRCVLHVAASRDGSCHVGDQSCQADGGPGVMTEDPHHIRDPGHIPNVDHDALPGLNDLDIQYLEIGVHSKTGETRKVAYVKLDGNKRPTVLYINGYLATVEMPKSMALYQFCKENGYPYVSFNYEGLELSSGEYDDVNIGMWQEDVLAVIDKLTEGPLVLVGASMGGIMSSYAALKRPERMHSILQVAPGFKSMADMGYELAKFDPQIAVDLKAGKTATVRSPWGNEFKVRLGFTEGFEPLHDARSLPIKCPFRIMHSIEDTTQSYTKSIEWGQKVESRDVDIILRRYGDHRLLRPRDIRTMINLLRDLIREYPVHYEH